MLHVVIPNSPFLFPAPSHLILSSRWAFGSNSLPIAGSVGVGVARRGQRQFQLPPRAIPPSRMGILSPGGISGVSPRHALASPNLGSQGRQVRKRGWLLPSLVQGCFLQMFLQGSRRDSPVKSAQRKPGKVCCMGEWGGLLLLEQGCLPAKLCLPLLGG